MARTCVRTSTARPTKSRQAARALRTAGRRRWDETFDIGSDTGTPVDDKDYQVPFKLTAKLRKLTLKLDRPQLTEKDIKELQTKLLGKD